MTQTPQRQAVLAYARAFASSDPAALSTVVTTLFAPDARINICHPFNEVIGPAAFLDKFLTPLSQAFIGLSRRDDILMAGVFEEADWITTHGNFAGHFAAPFIGLTPTDRLEYVRFGEFHRFDGDQIAESYIYLDLPQLMIATDQYPITDSPGRDRGYTGMIPGPAMQDGLLMDDGDPAEARKSYQIVTDMLSGLATQDEAWRPYWHENMLWHGPAAFGSFVGIENFAGFQVPFENAFSRWSGGSTGNGVTRHFTRFGDGNYTCSGGWPSLMAVRRGSFLGQPPSTDTLLMRVCDWWRRDGDLLVENWVIVDIPDVLLQMGVDLFAGQHDVAAGPRVTA